MCLIWHARQLVVHEIDKSIDRIILFIDDEIRGNPKTFLIDTTKIERELKK